jgi:hypothetical protein
VRRRDLEAGSTSTGAKRRHLPPLVVLVVGQVITGLLAWTCWVVNDRNETRLLRTQVQEAGTVLTAAVPDVETPLTSAVDIAEATDGNVATFATYITPYVGKRGPYVSVSLLQVAPVTRRVTVVGQPPELALTSPKVARAAHGRAITEAQRVRNLRHRTEAPGLRARQPGNLVRRLCRERRVGKAKSKGLQQCGVLGP